MSETETTSGVPAYSITTQPTIDTIAKEFGGDAKKIVPYLATQARWDWYEVAILLLGSRDAVNALLAEVEAAAVATAQQPEGAMAGTATTTA